MTEPAPIPQPILFLDIDGVLNSSRFIDALDASHRNGCPRPVRDPVFTQPHCTCFALSKQIDRDAIRQLNRVLKATKPFVVLSSSWRLLFDTAQVQVILVDHGFIGMLMDATPDGSRLEAFQQRRADGERITRGHEIEHWLKWTHGPKHPGQVRFAIADDSNDMIHLTPQLVLTDPTIGLTVENADALIERLLTKAAVDV